MLLSHNYTNNNNIALFPQAIGIFIGSLLMDIQTGYVAAQVATLACILVGGFYIQHFRYWLTWIPYASFITYTFRAILHFTFADASFQ